MARWPETTEPLLRERQAMSDEEFFAFVGGLLDDLPSRTLDDAQFERAISYPWGRAPGSCLLTGSTLEHLAAMPVARREALVAEYFHADDRYPLLAYGANASPERLALKLAHLDEEHRQALILAGDLEGFDVGAAAQGPWFLTMPATLVPSPGTSVRVGLLFVTSLQLTTLWWTELSYKLGALGGIVLRTDAARQPLSHVLLFISRFGAFAPTGEPATLVAIQARNRRWPALTQHEILAAAARTTLGDGADARELLEVAYENPRAFMRDHFAALQAASLAFESEHWTEMPADGRS